MPCTSIPDPRSCLRKMLKMNFMIVIMRLGYDWFLICRKATLMKQENPSSGQTSKPCFFLRFAPINPVGLIAQLLARLLDIHSRLPKLLMLVEKKPWFWMIFRWNKHPAKMSINMFHCFTGFLAYKFGELLYLKRVLCFFIFRIVRRRDSPMDNNLAHVSQQVAQAVGQGCLPFIGFQSIWIWMIQNPILQKPSAIHHQISSSQFIWDIFARSLGILSSHLLPFGTLDPWGDKGKEGHVGTSLVKCRL